MGHQIISPAMHCRPGQKPGRLLRLSQPFARKTANLKRFSAYIQIFAYDPSQFGHNNRLSFYSESKRAVFGPIKECLICPIICTTKITAAALPRKTTTVLPRIVPAIRSRRAANTATATAFSLRMVLPIRRLPSLPLSPIGRKNPQRPGQPRSLQPCLPVCSSAVPQAQEAPISCSAL